MHLELCRIILKAHSMTNIIAEIVKSKEALENLVVLHRLAYNGSTWFPVPGGRTQEQERKDLWVCRCLNESDTKPVWRFVR